MRFPLLALALAACVDHAGPSVSLYDKGDYAGAQRAADEGLQGHPDDDGLWGMKIRAALALGDADATAKAYAGYAKSHDSLDKELLRDLAVATLGQALASPSAKLKVAAIEAVQESELQALAEQVAERMTDENDRVAAAAAIAVLRAYPQAPHVATDALKSEDAEARRIAIDGIGKKVGKLAAADLERVADDADPRVRRTAIRWLGSTKDKDAVELLVKHQRDPDENVRAASAIALQQIAIGNLEAYGKTALADKALAVRLAGVDLFAAARLDDKLVALVDDPDPSVGLAAAIAVRAKHPELGGKAVERALADKEWHVRAGVANSLTRALDKQHALDVAHRMTSDAEGGVRLAAARVLAHAGDKAGAIAIFAAALDDVQAAADLAALGDARGAQALEVAVRDPKRTPEQRVAAANAHRAARHVTPGLVAALADPNALVRVEAAATLAVLAK